MADTFSTSLRLRLQESGANDSAWGSLANTTFQMVEASIAGRAAVTHDDTANYTLTTANGTADEARQMILNIGGALGAARNVVCPTTNKLYVVKNATTGGFAVTLKTTAGSGISIPNGKTMILFCDGTNVVEALDQIVGNLAIGGTLAVTGAITGTASGNLVSGGALGTPSSGTLTSCTGLPVAGGGTGVATFAVNGVLYGNTATNILVTAQGAANSILTANAGAPAFSQTPTINTSLTLGVSSSVTGALILAGSGGANKHTFQAAATPAAANTYVWPSADPAAATVLTASAPSGNVVTLTWAAAASATLTVTNRTTNTILAAGDNGTIINITSGTFSQTITAAATLGAGWNCWVINSGTGVVTLDPNGTETIDGLSTSLTLAQGAGYRLVCDGSNFKTIAVRVAGAAANGNFGVQLGSGAVASSLSSTAIGNNSSNVGSKAVTGAGACALGGSYASGTDSFAAAGTDNTGTYGAQGLSSIAMGAFAKATGNYDVAIGSGGNIASGGQSFAIGYASLASANAAFALGNGSAAAQIGKLTYTGTSFTTSGDCQYGLIILRGATTTNASVVLTSNGNAAGSTNQIIVASDKLMAFQGLLTGKQSGSANFAAYTIVGTLVNNAGTVTMPTGTITLIGADSIGLGTAATLAADNTNKGVTVTSGNKTTTNIHWNCTIWCCEVLYA